MAMMNNYKDMQDSLNTALNSTNSALIENDKYMESIQAKSAQFKNTVMGKWQEALDSNVIKNFIVVMTKLVDVFGNTEVILGLLITTFLLWKGTALIGLITSLSQIIINITATNAAISKLAVATKIYAGIMEKLNLIITKNPLFILATAITALVIGFNAVTSAVKRHKEETRKQIEVTQDHIVTLKSQKDSLKEIQNEYESLKNKENATIDDKKRLLEIQKELVEKYGVSATGINLEGEAYSNSTEAIKLRILALEKEAEAEQKNLESKIKTSDESINKDIKRAIQERDDIKKIVDEYQRFIDRGKGSKEDYRKLEEWTSAYQEEQKKIIELSKEKRKYLEYDAQDTIKTLENNGRKMSDTAKLVVSEFIKTLSLKPEDIETQKLSLHDFISEISNSDLDNLINKYNELASAISIGDDTEENTKKLSELSKTIKNLIYLLTNGNPELKEFADNLVLLFPSSVDVDKTTKAIDKYGIAISKLQDTYKESSAKIKDLYGFIDELNDKGLTESSISNIIENYKDYIPLLENESELRKQIVKDMDNYQNAIYDAYVKTKEEDRDFYNQVKNNHTDLFNHLVKLYNNNVDSWSNLAQAREAIELELINKLGNAWTKYFDAFTAGNIIVSPTSIADFKRIEGGGILAVDEKVGEALADFAKFQEATRNIASKFKNLDVASSLGRSSSGSSSAEKELYISDQYAIAIAKLNEELNILKHTKDKLSETSEEYRNILLKEIDIKQKQQQLAHEEANRLRSLREEVAEGTKEFDDYTKSIQSLGATWTDLQSEIDQNKFELNEILVKLNTSKIEYFNDLISQSESKLSNFNKQSKECSSELKKQIDLRKTTQGQIVSEITRLNNLIKTQNLDIKTKQLYIDTIKSLADQYKQLQSAIIQSQIELKDIETEKFINDLDQIDKAISPFTNKLSNITSNLDLLSESNADGKIKLMTQAMSANNDLVLQLESSLSELLSTSAGSAKEQEALSNSISKTRSQLYEAKKQTVLYAREIGKIQLIKIKNSFDKVTSSLENQINVTEHLIDMIVDGIPKGLKLDFNYATNVTTDGSELSDAQDLADAGININEQFHIDLLESQKDYNAKVIEEQREFFNTQQQQMQEFLDNLLNTFKQQEMAMSGIHLFDTTLSDTARLKGASEEVIETLKELERKLQTLEYERWKNSQKGTDKVVDVNNDGIDDITGQWISGYGTVLSETRSFFQDLINQYGSDFDTIVDIVKNKTGKIKDELPKVNDDYEPTPSTPGKPSDNTSPGWKPAKGTKLRDVSIPGISVDHDNAGNFTFSSSRGEWNYMGNTIPGVQNVDGYFTITDPEAFRAFLKPLNPNLYAKGTKGHPGGLAIISEEGSELLALPDGSLRLSGDKGPELVDLPKGTQVIPHNETKDILKNKSYKKGSPLYWEFFDQAQKENWAWFWIQEEYWDTPTPIEYYWSDTGEYYGSREPTQEEINKHYLGTSEETKNKNVAQSGIPTPANLKVPNIPSWTGSTSDLTNDLKSDILDYIFESNIPEIIGKTKDSINIDDLSNLFQKAINKVTNDVVKDLYQTIIDDTNKSIKVLRDEITKYSSIVEMKASGIESYIDEDGNEIIITAEMIEEAQQKAVEATNTLISTENKLKKAIKDRFDYQFDALEKLHSSKFDKITDDITHEISMLDLTGKKDFKKKISLTEQILGTAEEKKSGIEYLRDLAVSEQAVYDIGSMEYNDLQDRIDKYNEDLEDIDESILNIKNDIIQISFDSLNNSFNNFIQNVEKKLDILQFKSQFIDEDDIEGHFDNLTDIINAGLEEISTLTDKIKNIAIDPETSAAWAALGGDPEKQEEFLETFRDKLKNVITTVFNAQKEISKIPQQKLSKVANVENEIISLIKKRVEVEKESLNEQLKLTEENIDKRIKFINKFYDEIDRQEDLEDSQSKLKELYEERTKLMLDNSLEGKNKLKEINKKIEDEEKALVKTQRQRGKDLRIEALNDEKENAQKVTDEKQKELDKQLKNENLYAEAQKAIQTGQLEFLTIINGEVVKINGVAQTSVMDLSDAFTDFVDIYGEGLSVLGGQIKSDFINGIELANTAVKDLIGSLGDLATTSGYESFVNKNKTSTSTIDPDVANVEPIIPPRGYNVTDRDEIIHLVWEETSMPDLYNTNVASYGRFINNASDEDLSKLSVFLGLPENKSLSDVLVLPKSYDELQWALGEFMRKFKLKYPEVNYTPPTAFDTGGLTSAWGSGGKLGILHEKELVLKESDTYNILKTVDLTKNIIDNLKRPNLSNFASLFSKNDDNGVRLNIDNLINVEGNVDEKALPGLREIADYTINKLKIEFNKKGVFRGVY